MNHHNSLVIGKIVSAHGVKGYVKVYCEPQSFKVLRQGSTVLLKDSKGNESFLEILDARPQGKILLILLKGVSDRSKAETLAGSEILVERASLPELEEDTYYWADILGLKVYSSDDHYIGVVESIIETGSNDVYEVRTPEDKEILIPAIASVVLEIDLYKKIIRVDLPEGL